jgi:hypothetical protein
MQVPATMESRKAAVTRAKVIAASMGSDPSLTAAQAKPATAAGPGSRSGDAATRAASHQSRPSTSTEHTLVAMAAPRDNRRSARIFPLPEHAFGQ